MAMINVNPIPNIKETFSFFADFFSLLGLVNINAFCSNGFHLLDCFIYNYRNE